MFPGVDGFHWTLGHIVFLSLFFTVLLTLLATVLSAALRTASDVQKGRAAAISWKEEFARLPGSERCCRHEIAGRVARRICPNAFDCRHCTEYGHYAALPAIAEADLLGLDFPPDRYYHRGHTWVEPQLDGSLTVGLDDLAEHLIGKPDVVELPSRGSQIQSDGRAWRLQKNGHEIRVRAPIDGTVVETGAREKGWYLRLRPVGPVDLRHLLRGPEVGLWLAREIERLQLQLAPPQTAPALADGGVLIPGSMDSMPDADWDVALAGTFLEA